MELAEEIGLSLCDVEPYGATKAKVNIKVLERLANKPTGKYVIVCGYGLLLIRSGVTSISSGFLVRTE